MEAGSQLIAFFKGDEDADAVLAMVQEQVHVALGSDSAASVEVARGSVIVYITFHVAGLDIGKLVTDLKRTGLKYILPSTADRTS